MARATRDEIPTWAVVAALGVFLSVLAFGVGLWIGSSQGTKEADLGSSLVSGALIGFALLVVERFWADAAERRRRLADVAQDLRASATPDAGLHDDLSTVERNPD